MGFFGDCCIILYPLVFLGVFVPDASGEVEFPVFSYFLDYVYVIAPEERSKQVLLASFFAKFVDF